MNAYDANGKDIGKIDFETGLNKKDFSPKTYACAIKVLRQNWRQGTVACKGRGDVAFSGKKPWKQKGTGRARVGTISSPLWRKGGVTFGPQRRTRTLRITKSQRSYVLNNIYFSMVENDKISVVDLPSTLTDLSVKVPSTKLAKTLLKSLNLNNKKVILFLSREDSLYSCSFRNINNVKILLFDQPNAYSLSSCDHWLVLKKDISLFKEMVARWN